MTETPKSHNANQNVPPAHTRFVKGQSGNAGGRPKEKLITDAIRKRLSFTVEQFLTPTEIQNSKLTALQTKLTIAEFLADRFIRAAIQGNSEGTRQFRELLDRVEGRVPLPLMGVEGGEFVLNLVSHIARPDRTAQPRKRVKAPNRKVQ